MPDVTIYRRNGGQTESTTYTVETLPKDVSEVIDLLRVDEQPIRTYHALALLYYSTGDVASYKRLIQAGSDSGKFQISFIDTLSL
jgi:hypothetical protein